MTVEQRKAESKGVTEDDVNEIKQDISAFRCELIEILKNSGMNTSTASGTGTGETVSTVATISLAQIISILRSLVESFRSLVAEHGIDESFAVTRIENGGKGVASMPRR